MSSGVMKSFVTKCIFDSFVYKNTCKMCFVRRKSSICFNKTFKRRFLSHANQQYRETIFNLANRKCSSTSSQHGIAHTEAIKQIDSHLKLLCDEIKKELICDNKCLQSMTHYLFDDSGKAFRPMLVLLIAGACNYHIHKESFLKDSQITLAQITELVHVASLIHDDVIDGASTRRGKPSVNSQWGQQKAIATGDFLLSRSSQMLARLRNDDVALTFSQILEDLIKGEFMQLGSNENETKRFNHYLRKTFKKTASLIANSCKAVAILGNSSQTEIEIAYQYGKNTGIAFQLVDDLLDFISCDQLMGKPTAADLRLGLATAPVLFAAQEFPELNSLIMRRFSEDGDVERARDLVAKSQGIMHTQYLAEQHCKEAERLIKEIRPSAYRDELLTISNRIINRMK